MRSFIGLDFDMGFAIGIGAEVSEDPSVAPGSDVVESSDGCGVGSGLFGVVRDLREPAGCVKSVDRAGRDLLGGRAAPAKWKGNESVFCFAEGFGEFEDAFTRFCGIFRCVPALADGGAGFCDEAGQLWIVVKDLTSGFDGIAGCEEVEGVPPKLILALQIECAGVILGEAATREAPGMGETREEGADWPPLNGDGSKEF
jgi:hypothetical protein